MKYTKRARDEMKAHNLLQDKEYQTHTNNYIRAYEARKPAKTIPIKNMIRALRMMVWENTPEDWARLHVTESYLKFYS
jgi:hypothetical protein